MLNHPVIFSFAIFSICNFLYIIFLKKKHIKLYCCHQYKNRLPSFQTSPKRSVVSHSHNTQVRVHRAKLACEASSADTAGMFSERFYNVCTCVWLFRWNFPTPKATDRGSPFDPPPPSPVKDAAFPADGWSQMLQLQLFQGKVMSVWL